MAWGASDPCSPGPLHVCSRRRGHLQVTWAGHASQLAMTTIPSRVRGTRGSRWRCSPARTTAGTLHRRAALREPKSQPSSPAQRASELALGSPWKGTSGERGQLETAQGWGSEGWWQGSRAAHPRKDPPGSGRPRTQLRTTDTAVTCLSLLARVGKTSYRQKTKIQKRSFLQLAGEEEVYKL